MTTNPKSIVDGETFTVRRTIEIDAPVEKVWRAVTEPKHISEWFGQVVLVGSGVGVEGTIGWPDGPAVPIRVETFDPPRTVTYRWCNGEVGETTPINVDAGPSTVFTFTLEPRGGGTRLSVVETGFESMPDPAATLESHRQGWDGELDKLVVLLEARR